MPRISSITTTKSGHHPGKVFINVKLSFYPVDLAHQQHFALTLVGFDQDYGLDHMIIHPNYPHASILAKNDDYLFKFQRIYRPSSGTMSVRFVGSIGNNGVPTNFAEAAMDDDSSQRDDDEDIELRVWAVLVPQSSYAVTSSEQLKIERNYDITGFPS